MSVLNELQERSLIHQFTGLSLEEILLHKRTVYIGMDPTAPAIHIGYLIPITLCSILRKHGCKIIVLLGGATAMIGDPTGKSYQRKTLTQEEITSNLNSLQANITKFFPDSEIVNNYNWLGNIELMEFLNLYARHVSVNTLIKLDSFQKRLSTDQPLSMLEIFYPILQGYDFYYLHKHHNCTLQLGGSDQWANILYGVDLVKRLSNTTVYGLTCPLLLNQAGEKMGKTGTGTIWLDEKLCSVFDFWQYWRNTSDADTIRFAKTLLNLSTENHHTQDFNSFKKLFATQMTALVHGEEKALIAQQQATTMFEQKDFSNIPVHTICKSAHSSSNTESRLCDILVSLSWAKTLSQAKDLIKSGSITVNHEKELDPSSIPSHNSILCKGKKLYYRILIN